MHLFGVTAARSCPPSSASPSPPPPPPGSLVQDVPLPAPLALSPREGRDGGFDGRRMVVGRGGAAMGSETLRSWYPDALLGFPIDIAALHWEERSCPLAKRSDALGCLQPTYGQLSSLRAPQPPVSSCTRCAFPFPRGVLHPFVAPSIPPRFPLSLCANIHPPTRLPSLHLPHLSPPHPTCPHITPSPSPPL